MGDTGIESIEMGNMKWVYINWEHQLLLVAAADKTEDSIVLKRQLETICKNFLDQFNIEKGFFKKWNGNVTMFSKFLKKMDELIDDWTKVSKVTNIAKMMNLLEVYQQILHIFSRVLPSIKPDAREELTKRMNQIISKLPYFMQNISYGPNGWNILSIDITARDCREELLHDGLQYILQAFILEMKTIFKEDLFFEIAKKLVYPQLIADWNRIADFKIDTFLLKLFLS